MVGLEAVDGEPRAPVDGTGPLAAAISRAVVAVHREHVGRGPTQTRTFVRDAVIVVVMQDTLTRAEHTLVDAGRSGAVLRLRDELHETMHPVLVGHVERLTGRGVRACLNSGHVGSDVWSLVFVLVGPVAHH